MKRPIIAGIALVCLVGLVFLFRALFLPRQVQTGEVTRGDLITLVYATGRVSADSLATLRSKSGGVVLDAVRREGMSVRKGALLLRTDPGDQALGLRSARNAVATAEVHLRTRERELRQQEALFQSGTATRTAADEARKEYDLARIALEKERNNLGLAEQKLADTEVRAPFAGIVISATANIGDLLPPNAECYQLVAPGSLMISADVAEQDVARLKPGQACIVAFDAYAQRRWKGTVTRIVPRTDEATKTSRVILQLPERPGDLSVGMTATVNVITEEHRGVLLIPSSALVAAGGRKVLFEVADGRVRADTVDTGGSDGKVTLQTGGRPLPEGTRVVLQPPAGLADATRVRAD